MLDVFARVQAKAGQEPALAAILLQHLPEVRATAGCLAVHDYRSLRDAGLLYIHSRWSEPQAFERYASLPETERFIQAAEPHMAQRPLRAIRTLALEPDGGAPLPEGELTVFAPLHARAGQELAAEQALRSVHELTAREPGCRCHRICRCVRDSALFYVHSIWSTAAAFEEHLTQAHTRRFVAQIEPLLDHALQVTRARRID